MTSQHSSSTVSYHSQVPGPLRTTTTTQWIHGGMEGHGDHLWTRSRLFCAGSQAACFEWGCFVFALVQAWTGKLRQESEKTWM